MQEIFLMPSQKGENLTMDFLQPKKGEKIVRYIWRASFTRNGVTYYAKNYGKKAFKIPIYSS